MLIMGFKSAQGIDFRRRIQVTDYHILRMANIFLNNNSSELTSKGDLALFCNYHLTQLDTSLTYAL
jgi:hypothetical protein